MAPHIAKCKVHIVKCRTCCNQHVRYSVTISTVTLHSDLRQVALHLGKGHTTDSNSLCLCCIVQFSPSKLEYFATTSNVTLHSALRQVTLRSVTFHTGLDCNLLYCDLFSRLIDKAVKIIVDSVRK